MKITVHGELNIYFSFHRKLFCEITLHGYYGNHDSREKKLAISHFTGKKRADHKSRKYPLPPSCKSHQNLHR